MLPFLVRHEFTLLSRRAVVRSSVGVFLIALAASSIAGVVRVQRERSLLETFDARSRAMPPQLTEANEVRADIVANDRGRLVLLPPATLSALAVGQSDVYANYFNVTARSLDALVSGDQIEHPLGVAAGRFDPAFVVLFLYPLLLLAISYDLTASERDTGTLRMVLSQPVRLLDVVAGKWLARFLVLTIPVIVVPLLAVFWIDSPTVSTLVRAAIWTLCVFAYGLLWSGIALWINSIGRPASANALILASLWLTLAVVGPACVNLLVAVTYPMPSRVEAAVQARAATQDAAATGNRDLGQFLVDHPTSANVGREGMKQFALLQAARDREVADRLAAVASRFEERLASQRRLASWLSVVSPTMIAQVVLLDAAGTSTDRFSHFRDEAARFQSAWRDYFEPRVLNAATLTREEFAGAPQFSFDDEPVTEVLSRSMAGVIVLLVLGVASVALGFRRYRAYQV